MKLSLYSVVAWRHPFGLAKALQWAKEYGYEAVGIRGFSLDTPDVLRRNLDALGYDMIRPSTMGRQGRQDLKSQLDSLGLVVSDLSTYCPLTVPEGEARDWCLRTVKDYVNLAADIGSERLRIIGNTLNPLEGISLPLEEALRLFISGLDLVTKAAKQRGVRVLIENEENAITRDIQSCLRILDAVESHSLGLAFDPLNLYFAGGDVMGALEKLKGRIEMVHVKNARRVPKGEGLYNVGEHGYEWTNLRQGDLSYATIIDLLSVQGFRGYLMYEYANPFKGMGRDYWDSLPNPATSAAEAAEFLRL